MISLRWGTTNLATSAAILADQGIPVVPLHRPVVLADGVDLDACSCGRLACLWAAEHVASPAGVAAASTDPATIARWWSLDPRAGVGIATGQILDVIEVSGEIGEQVYAALRARLALGPVVLTGRSDWQFWAKPSGRPTTAQVRGAYRVLWRGEGDHALAPPSLATTGATARWVEPSDRRLPVAAIVNEVAVEVACRLGR